MTRKRLWQFSAIEKVLRSLPDSIRWCLTLENAEYTGQGNIALATKERAPHNAVF